MEIWIADEWVVCEDYPSYLINRLGQVKSTLTNKIIRPSKLKTGYMCVGLRKGGKSFTVRLHRLIAKAFIPNPDNKPHVDHINGVRDDNRIDNLRWCTNKENQNFELARVNNSKALIGRKQSKETVEKRTKTLQKSVGVKVDQYTLSGEFICRYNGYNEAERITGVWMANIRKCCIGKYKHAGGYIWKIASTEVTFENSPQQVELSLLGKLGDKPTLTNYTLAESKAIIGGLSEKYCKEVPKEYYSEIEVKEVITKIDTKKFKSVKSIEFDGKIYESSYNNNYFYNEVDNCLILEICNDECTMYYYKVTKDDLVYLGLVDDVFGIFSEYFESVDGIVELNSSHC